MVEMRDLIAERHRAGLRQADISGALGITRSRLALLETAREVRPTEAWAEAYMAAIAAQIIRA